MPGRRLDGYLLRTNQLSGTDEIWLERLDNGSAVTLLDDPQELAAGDTHAPARQGHDASRPGGNNGTSWSRLGFVHGRDL